MSDFDSPWKEALELYLEAFFAFFFPAAHADINWSRTPEFLDKELLQVTRDAELGRRYVDKLVKVWLKTGEEAWLLVHIEIQSQEDAHFARRMYTYNYRVFDLYNREVVSLAVLSDDSPRWRPTSYSHGRWGSRSGLWFEPVKLLDYAAHEATLEADRNPFAALVLAHLKTMETRRDPLNRQTWKLRLIRGLYERGLNRQVVRQLFHLIDWMMDLPALLEETVWQEVHRLEQEQNMPFLDIIERKNIEMGELLAHRKLLRQLLARKFQELPDTVVRKIESSTDLARLEAAVNQVFDLESLDQLDL